MACTQRDLCHSKVLNARRLSLYSLLERQGHYQFFWVVSPHTIHTGHPSLWASSQGSCAEPGVYERCLVCGPLMKWFWEVAKRSLDICVMCCVAAIVWCCLLKVRLFTQKHVTYWKYNGLRMPFYVDYIRWCLLCRSIILFFLKVIFKILVLILIMTPPR